MKTTEERALLAVLEAMNRSTLLREKYILKGGNALRFGYQSPRSSQDLDFTSNETFSRQTDEESKKLLQEFCDALDKSLHGLHAKYGFAAMRVQMKK